ncbi:contractile injection system protein, VgrG/Pvc8 family [Meridianimarinicoccus sp. RP-17]|uniref:contractile injection system protein, VgrG/Pvc8 family n=1 Tax=Meridianimarinicoccus zhengii TaxID=2056810 RepID=UPI000DACED83|nr:contractile injection system protein, VgrG/Pvc8 family [Phycocomes zhengii]
MTWLPAFQLVVGGADITSVVTPRLLSMTIRDAPGFTSDVLEITLADDARAPIAIPRRGAIITCALGYLTGMVPMGEFIADEIELSGPPGTMTIRATASVQGASDGGRSALTDQKSRSWPAGTALGDLVATIATEHGLRPAVASELADIELPHIDQLDESDMGLLTRVARLYDALAKPAGGALAVVRRAAGLSVTGLPLPSLPITPQQVTSWRVELARRDAEGSVIAVWRDRAGAVDVEVTAGEGEPVRRLRQTFPTEASAQAAANAALRSAARGAQRLELQMPGRPTIGAEATLQLAAFRPGVNGAWVVTEVVHRLTPEGLITGLSAEKESP